MVSIAFTGGGTGGHIYPGLAVASRLKKTSSCRIFWIGSGTGMDKNIVEEAGIEFFGIPSGKLRRYFSLKNILDIFKVAAGFFSARRILKKEKPALLFSKGGFVSVPPCAAAFSLKIPVFSHESDYSPGLATRINLRFSEKVFIPYKESLVFFGNLSKSSNDSSLNTAGKIIVSGNPIRPEFSEADPAIGRNFLGLKAEGEEAAERILLVLGGSLGSREINELIMESLPELTRYYTVVHQYGEGNAETTALNNKTFDNNLYKPYAYLRSEIPHLIAASELIICRSGAGTIWECKYLKKPMILIPLRGSGTRGDQVENARLFEEAGAALTFIPGAGVSAADTSALLSDLVISLAENPEKRKLMCEAEISEKDAAEFIAGEIADKINI